MELTPQQKKKLERYAKLLDNKELATAEEFSNLEERINEVASQMSVNTEQLFEILTKLQEEVKKKSEEGLSYEVDEAKIVESVLSQIPTPQDGKDYVLTEADKKFIASLIKVPVVEKVVERTIVEQPIVNEVTHETKIENPFILTGEDAIDKINSDESEKKIRAEKVENVGTKEDVGNLFNRTQVLNQLISGVDRRLQAVEATEESDIAGTIATNQIAYGTGTNTIGGSNNFKYTPGQGLNMSESIFFPVGDIGDATTLLSNSGLSTTGSVSSFSMSAFTFTADVGFVKSGGTSSEFLKADGSVDSNTYLTTATASSTYVPYTGATTNVDLGSYQINALTARIGTSGGQRMDYTSGGYLRGYSTTNVQTYGIGSESGDAQFASLNIYDGVSTVASIDSTGEVNTHTIHANTSAGLAIHNTSHGVIALLGAGGGLNATFYDGVKLDSQTASRILSTDASKNITALDTLTYPDLTELSYLKGATSAVQTQLNGKQATLVSGTNIKTVNGTTLLGSGDLGTIGVGYGGTGTSTTMTTGSLLFAGPSGVYSQDNANLFWDDTNNRLGVGTNAPSTLLHLLGTSTQARIGYSVGQYANITMQSAGRFDIAVTGTTPQIYLNTTTTIGTTLTSYAGIQPNLFAYRLTNTAPTNGTAAFIAQHDVTSTNSSYIKAGTIGVVTTNFGSGNHDLLYGTYYQIVHNGTGTVTNTSGARFIIQRTWNGPITNAYGAQFNIQSSGGTSGAITNAYYNYFFAPTTNTTTPITNFYGLYFEALNVSGVTNTPHVIYQAGASDLNYFNGKIGLGVTGASITERLTIADAGNIAVGTTTGTKIGTATTQKLGVWNATPIVQPTTAVAAATFVANTSGIVDDSATFDGYTIGQVVKALRNIGLLA